MIQPAVALTAPTIRFDPIPHRYFLEPSGEELPSVTACLQECGLIDFSMIPRHILDAAAERGTAVHAACHYLDDGDLDWDTLDPRYRGYVEAWERFRHDWQFEPLLVEHMIWSPHYRYAGRMDRVGTLPRKDGGHDLVILDFKTGDWVKGYRYQMAAYNGALDEPRKYRRLPLQLCDNGEYRSHENKCPPQNYGRDLNVFHGAVAVWHGKRAA